LEGRVAETVVGGALLGVLQDLVGEIDLLEAHLRLGIAGIAVRMELHGQLAECRLELLFIGAPRHAERFVKVRLRQESRLRTASRRHGSPAGRKPVPQMAIRAPPRKMWTVNSRPPPQDKPVPARLNGRLDAFIYDHDSQLMSADPGAGTGELPRHRLSGEGAPPVVLLNGAGARLGYWSRVQPDLAPIAATLAYDRRVPVN